MDEQRVQETPNPVRVVAFLGKGPYQECDYNGPDGTYKCERTRYATRAIVEYLCKGRSRKIDEVVIVSTPEARDAPAVKNQPHPTQWEALTDAIRGLRDDIPIRYRDIPWGGSSDELWKIFDRLRECFEVSSGTDLVVDITHGFRSQPFFAAAVLSFVRLVRNVSPAAIYYAAFEAKDSDGRAPIWDVTGFVEVLDWALALHLFLNTGRAQRLNEILAGEAQKFSSAGDKGGDRGKFDPFFRAVNAWSENFDTLRVGDLLLKSGQRPSSAERLKQAIDDEQFRTVIASRLKPIEPLLDEICKKFAEPLVCDNSLVSEQGRHALLNLARLYSEMGRYIEAATVVREATVTLFATSEEGWRPGRSWKPGFSVQARREAERNCGITLGRKFNAKVSDVRNDLDHAGFNEEAHEPAFLRERVAEAIKWFKEFSTTWQGFHPRAAQTFLNLSNHPLSEWGEEQKQAVLAMGCAEIRDLPFPQVPPHASPQDVVALAKKIVSDVPPSVTHAMVMGEFTLTFELVRRLQKRGVRCFVATTTRDVEQRGDEKVVRFHFEGFREYPELEF